MNPIPLSKWESQGNVWPTRHSWYHMLRPENLRDELAVDAGAMAGLAVWAGRHRTVESIESL